MNVSKVLAFTVLIFFVMTATLTFAQESKQYENHFRDLGLPNARSLEMIEKYETSGSMSTKILTKRMYVIHFSLLFNMYFNFFFLQESQVCVSFHCKSAVAIWSVSKSRIQALFGLSESRFEGLLDVVQFPTCDSEGCVQECGGTEQGSSFGLSTR